MQEVKDGIEVTREELWAFLAFAAVEGERAAVHFKADGSRLCAGANDGKRSAVLTVDAGKKPHQFEWALSRDFVDECRRRLLDGEILLFEVGSGGALKSAWRVSADSGRRISDVTCKEAVVSTQTSIGDLLSGLAIPESPDWIGSWCAIDPVAFKPLNRIRVAAAKCPVSLFPGKSPTDPMHFKCTSDGGTWTGAISPVAVVGPGAVAVVPESEPTPLERAAAAKTGDADDDEDGGIVPDDYGKGGEPPPALATQKKRRGAKSKGA